MNALVAFVAGLLFGSGLLVSGMTNPANIIAFLDVAGDWKPALAFTMAAAVGVTLPAFAVVRARGSSLRGRPVAAVDRLTLDRSLVIGSALFGVGWGLSGICPGPGLILLTSGDLRALVFVAAVAAGAVVGGALLSRAD